MDFATLARQHAVRFSENEAMSRHTSFRIGGPARYYAAADVWQASKLYSIAKSIDLPFFLMGNGSNLLVRDEGYAGLIVKLVPETVKLCGSTVLEAPAGALLSTLSATAQQKGLAGLEFAQGIPGSVGGGVFMNAGAYGGQLSDILTQTGYIDLDDPQRGEQMLSAANHHFAYRHSVYMERPNWMITRVFFQLAHGNREEIAAKMAGFAASRRDKQPLEYPSGGSAYKRPEGHFAGKLIEEAGLKGFRIGGAQVSEKHAGFIVNRGGATCAQVLALMAHVEAQVEQRTGIRLERELRLL